MFITFYFLILLLYMVSSKFEPFDGFLKYDYCKLNCINKNAAHSACRCGIRRPREEITFNPDQITFRQKMVDYHNEWRNEVAVGNGIIGPAADMMVMNYDLELEYIARCYGVTYYTHTEGTVTGHDACRVRYGNLSSGQNLAGSSNKDATEFGIGWYKKEMEFIKGYEHVIDNFTTIGDKAAKRSFGHLTQVLYWGADRIGCWRVWKPDNKRSWLHTLLCNYGSTVYDHSGNLMYSKVFTRGQPCSQCPNDTKCNTKYPSLCGELLPVPKSTPPILSKPTRKSRKKHSRIILTQAQYDEWKRLLKLRDTLSSDLNKAHNIILVMTVTFVFLMQN